MTCGTCQVVEVAHLRAGTEICKKCGKCGYVAVVCRGTSGKALKGCGQGEGKGTATNPETFVCVVLKQITNSQILSPQQRDMLELRKTSSLARCVWRFPTAHEVRGEQRSHIISRCEKPCQAFCNMEKRDVNAEMKTF